jgi:hypothetical protein
METATKAMIEAPSFDDTSAVQSVLYREYIKEVQSTVKEVLSEIREENPGISGDKLREAFSDRLHETIDGHGWIIYNAKARLVLWMSDNEDAYYADFGGEDAPSDNTKAFYAMLADCNDYAERNSLLRDASETDAPAHCVSDETQQDSEEEEEEEDN